VKLSAPSCLPAVFALALFSGTAAAQLNCNVGVHFYPSGAIKSCNLNGHHRIYTAQGQAVTCADGHTLEHYPNGKLKSCTLAIAFVVDSVRCAAHSRIELNSDGTLSRCEHL
jgi:hypothetical protein